MSSSKKPLDARTAQGQQLARRIYDYKIDRLENMSQAEKDSLLREFPLLSNADFEYVINELLAAKRYEQERVGWLTVPHDAAVIILVILTSLVNLQAGIIAGVAVLVLLEGIFQFIFDRRIYRPLSTLVWFTYPAYVWLGYLLYRQGTPWLWIAVIIIMVWGGMYILGAIARLPMRLYFEARAKKRAETRLPKKT
ncbi:MAG: hypothetical protein GYA34_07665 [Chloroflexi bacterium]|nr:hypothetical protein [Chloroflexota bacterium]